MATTQDFIQFACSQIDYSGTITYKKMFGEYMIYINDKPVLLVCDNTVYIKMLPELAQLMKNEPKGFPYKGSKEHYILDIDNCKLVKQAITIAEPICKLPQKKKSKTKES